MCYDIATNLFLMGYMVLDTIINLIYNKTMERSLLQKQKHNEYMKQWYAKRKISGKCRYCDNKAINNMIFCVEHNIQHNIYLKNNRDKHKNLGVCEHCSSPAMPGGTRCHKHHAIHLADSNRRNQERVSNGICPQCGKLPLASHSTSGCEMCLNKDRIQENKLKRYLRPERKDMRRERYYEIKAEVIAHYGGECTCCGDDHQSLITVDHIIPKKQHGHDDQFNGRKLWSWLKRNGYPSGFQLLCWSCNIGKGQGVHCPAHIEHAKIKAYRIKLRQELQVTTPGASTPDTSPPFYDLSAVPANTIAPFQFNMPIIKTDAVGTTGTKVTISTPTLSPEQIKRARGIISKMSRVDRKIVPIKGDI